MEMGKTIRQSIRSEHFGFLQFWELFGQPFGKIHFRKTHPKRKTKSLTNYKKYRTTKLQLGSISGLHNGDPIYIYTTTEFGPRKNEKIQIVVFSGSLHTHQEMVYTSNFLMFSRPKAGVCVYIYIYISIYEVPTLTPESKPVFQVFESFLGNLVICMALVSKLRALKALNCQNARFWNQFVPGFVKSTITALFQECLSSLVKQEYLSSTVNRLYCLRYLCCLILTHICASCIMFL